MVMLHIKFKGITKCSNMVANNLPPRGLGQNSTFSEQGHVAYQFKGMEHRPPCKHIFSPDSHPQPVGWIKRLNKIKNLNAIILNTKLSGKLILKERCID